MDANERKWGPGSARDVDRASLNALVERVVGAAYEVSNVLGTGFLEKVYQQALVNELLRRGIQAEADVPIPVYYKGDEVGYYFADIIVGGCLILELKCIECFNDEHLAQCLNYLKATGVRLGLLINFQHAKVGWKRVVREF